MRVMILGGKSQSTNAVIHALSLIYPDISVIIEDGVPLQTFLGKRIKRFGVATVFGQLLFMLFIPKYLRLKSKDRIEEIKKIYDLDTNPLFNKSIRRFDVKSINDDKVVQIIQKEKPDIIIVNGTRIISAKVLESTNVPFINMHVGITPKYRGVHGGYWAVVNNDFDNCGVTIHLVNTGIDTGDIIAQKRIEVTEKDNFVTYPYLQVGEGIKLEKEFLKEFEHTKKVTTIQLSLPSRIWSHPTIIQYVINRNRSR